MNRRLDYVGSIMRTWSILVVSLALTTVVSCGKNNESASTCGTAADCRDGQICNAGVCEEPPEEECSGDPDCPGGFACVANQCERRDEIDMGSDSNDIVDMGGNNDEDMNFDNIPPEVVAITPADGTEDAPRDQSVTVEFSEAMRATTINIQSIVVRDPANQDVPMDVSYDEATFTATLAPQGELRRATPYRVVVTQFVRDEAGNTVTDEVESTFYTAYEEPAGIRTIAETWAPYVYQAIAETTGGGPNADLPTTVMFDSNDKARDNKGKAVLQSTKTKATVYYSVVESKTHYFVTYAMYYPLRVTATESFEHDFAGALLVIDKVTEKLVLVDGVKVQEGADTSLGYKPDDSDVDGVAQTNFDTFPAADLIDGTHYPMFINAGEEAHATCPWTIDGDVPVCPHNAGEFPDGTTNGVLMKPGDTGQTFNEATENADGLLEMTYELVPLPSSLWVRRTRVGPDLLWQQTQVYSPSGMDRPATTTGGSPILLPNKLFSDDATTFGKPPFQWMKTSTETNNGQWLLDPAYLLLNRYDFGDTWSQEYCFNVFLDVNLRNDANNPECGSDT